MPTKNAYQFDHAGLFIGETIADESPLEPGVYLLPARTTLTPPPGDIPGNKWPRWTGNAWTLVNRPAPAAAGADDPIAKLRDFLSHNPDVAALLQASETP
jgi:hypothetical protein